MKHLAACSILAFLLLMPAIVIAQPAAAPGATEAAATDVAVANPEPAPAPATGAPADNLSQDPLGTIDELVQAIRAGHWRLVAATILALAMLALAWVRSNWAPAEKYFGGDRGGAILVGILALGGAVSVALASDSPLDWRLFVGALGVMWTAVGGFTWVKRIWSPKDEV